MINIFLFWIWWLCRNPTARSKISSCLVCRGAFVGFPEIILYKTSDTYIHYQWYILSSHVQIAVAFWTVAHTSFGEHKFSRPYQATGTFCTLNNLCTLGKSNVVETINEVWESWDWGIIFAGWWTFGLSHFEIPMSKSRGVESHSPWNCWFWEHWLLFIRDKKSRWL